MTRSTGFSYITRRWNNASQLYREDERQWSASILCMVHLEGLRAGANLRFTCGYLTSYVDLQNADFFLPTSIAFLTCVCVSR